MAQPPANPAVPQARSTGDEATVGNVSVGNSMSSSIHAENYVPSITTPALTGLGVAAPEVDPNKKRNTSFKITGVLPSRPPSNSDDDDADESTVTEDDVPDTVLIHTDSTTGNGPNQSDTDGSRVSKPIGPSVPKPSGNVIADERQATPNQPSHTGPSSNTPVPATSTQGNTASNAGQRRNSKQVEGSNKGGGDGKGGVLPSIKTGMALGYRFNIFVYDHKLGSGFESHRTPASQVRATAASIFVQLTDEKDAANKAKKEQGDTSSKGQESAQKETAASDLPFLQIAGNGTRVPGNLMEAEHKSHNIGSVLAASNAEKAVSSEKQAGEKHGPQDRFKVVKIETVVAKEIGRWTLVDYANRSAPVMPTNPTYFPAHLSPAMSLSGGKTPLKSALKNSAAKDSQHSKQIQSNVTSTQASNVKNIPVAASQQTKQQQAIPGTESSKNVPSKSAESNSNPKVQDNTSAQQPSTIRVTTTASSVNPQVVQVPSSAVQPGVSGIPQHINTGIPATASIQNTPQVRDGSPIIDARALPQSLSGASTIQVVDISSKKHESIAQQQQQLQQPPQQQAVAQNIPRQSKSPSQFVDGSGGQVVQTTATSRNSSIPPQQHHTMQQQPQQPSHMATPQLPILHTSSSSNVAPSHLNVISPLPYESIVNPLLAQHIPSAHHEQQPIQADSVNRASHIHSTQAMDVKHQYPSTPGGDVSFQNQQNKMNINSIVVPKEGGSVVQPVSQQGVAPVYQQPMVKNEPLSAPVQSHQPHFQLQNEAKEFHQTSQARGVGMEQAQMTQQHPNMHQMALNTNPNIMPQQNIAMMNLQQHVSGAQQTQQLQDKKGAQVINTMAQAQPNSIPTNVTNASMIMPQQPNNQDPHMQPVRMIPSNSGQQLQGERVPTKVYVPNQSSSGTVMEAHLIQQSMKQVQQPSVNTSRNESQLQQQTSVQMQSGIGNYTSIDPTQSIRQMQNQTSGQQLQQSNQNIQYMQQPIQTMPSQQVQQPHQQQQATIVQQQQILQTGSQASKQPSNVVPAHGVQTHIQFPHQQTVVLQNFQPTNLPTPTQDQQSQIPQRVDPATTHSKPQQYAPSGSQPIGVSNLPQNQLHIQPAAGSVPVKQPLVGATVAQNSSQQSANNTLPPSRAEPNMANYGIKHVAGGNTSQTTPQQFSGGATQIEKINLVNAQQITVSGATFLPTNEHNPTAITEPRRDNVGEQLMNRLEQISRNQGNLQNLPGEGVEGESQEISSLTRHFPAPTQERKQSLEEYSHARATPGPDLGHGVSTESTVISDSVQTGLDSPVSVFKPITAPPDTLEERTLSPPQCSASGTNHGAIDNRIEQAMDLVKSHLMNAVRSEVEELKEKIIRLEDTIINLQGENEVLKRNVPSDVLRQISNTTTPLLAVQNQQQQSTSSTASTVIANVGQQQSPTTVQPTPALANTTVLSTGATQVPPTQTNVAPPQTVNIANPPSVVSGGANQGVANNSTPSQMAPTYLPQSTSQHVAAVNNQVPTPKPPQ